ncbi:DUF5074 domain-containing protein [Gelidibacter maritimus]|uniref:YncE family protein n=1 Tax=Gelidibacter maritimus TaxID=2761487 RepID=A0A7W2M222_9FLAO|nr:DUF5074 domain-containing protein [Gelidibacter maritimus]MBA6151294.1 YncE family protein [Gelidibacter maritimus]
MKIKNNLVLALSVLILSFSCSSDDDNHQQEPQGAYEDGILVTNEGNFDQGNGAVTFISDDFAYAEQKVFFNVNGTLLGDTVQSIDFYGDLAYIVVNNSQKIEVVNRYTFQSVATIDSGLSNPRYITFLSGKGYVTNWGDGSNPDDDYVAVINLENHTVSSTISVEEGPERIVANETSIYVAHQGGYSQNNVVSVIKPNSDEVETITVGDVPNSMVFDSQGMLYVLSGGIPAWTGNETGGQLDVINTSSNTVSTTIEFVDNEHPSNLSYGESLYYTLNGGVYKLAIGSQELSTTPEIEGVNFNFMTVHDNILYGVGAEDYTSNGTLESFDLATNAILHSKEVGINPGGIYFND